MERFEIFLSPRCPALIEHAHVLQRCDSALYQRQTHGLVVADAVKISTMLSFICLEARTRDPAIKAAFDAIKRVRG